MSPTTAAIERRDSSAEDELEQFIGEWLVTIEPRPSAFSLGHVLEGSSSVVVETVELERKGKGGARPKASDLCARFLRTARAHAGALGSGLAEKYSLGAMQGRTCLAEWPIRIEPVVGLGASYARTPVGHDAVMAATFRHLERRAELLERGEYALLSNLARSHDRTTRENERLQAAHFKTCELLEDLLDRKALRATEAESARKSEERKDKALEIGADLVRCVMGHLSGVGPASTLIRKLPPEAVPALIESLDEEGRGAVRELLAMVAENRESQERLLKLRGRGASSSRGSTDGSSAPSPDGDNGSGHG